MGAIQPLFLEFDTFSKIHGSTEAFHVNMQDIYAANLHAFAEEGYDLLKMVSEVMVLGEIEGVGVKGYIDFLYDKKRTAWNFPNNISSDYVILDGKWNVGKYVKKEQLFLYSYLLRQTKGIAPERLGFLDWQKHKFSYFEYDPKYEDYLLPLVRRAKLKLQNLQKTLSAGTQKEIPLFEYSDVEFTASQANCAFCQVIKCCPFAKKANVFPLDMLYGANYRKELKKEFQGQMDTANSSILDISF